MNASLATLIAACNAVRDRCRADLDAMTDDDGAEWIDAYYAVVEAPCVSPADAIAKCQFVALAMDGKDMGWFEEEKVIRQIAALAAIRSPIMVLFDRWNALRDRSDEPGISDDEVSRRCDKTNEVMHQLLTLPPTDAADLAAKLMCFTHYGVYSLDECAGGDRLMQEMASMVLQSDRLPDKFQPARGGSSCA